ncbi:MAG TPA: hypothetical protein VLZ05_03025 [Mycobacterium sp.]|nr:hypothetical protein [Mycobacterium sp.]HUH67921.1 hypothetical protein [Mycobacterium sp.]
MTLSAVFRSVFSPTPPPASAAALPGSPELEDVRRCEIHRQSFPMTEIALPAMVLRNRFVAK